MTKWTCPICGALLHLSEGSTLEQAQHVFRHLKRKQHWRLCVCGEPFEFETQLARHFRKHGGVEAHLLAVGLGVHRAED